MPYKTEHLFMRKLFALTVLSLIVCSNVKAELTLLDTLPTNPETKDSLIFEKVDVEAEFPGGLSAWWQFLEANLNPQVPAEKGAPDGSYTVIARFIVDKDGTVSDFKALTKYGYGMEKEVLRVLKNSPKWTPASQNGRNVKAYRSQPVTFIVQTEKKKKRRKDD